jgi:hypothetical protein
MPSPPRGAPRRAVPARAIRWRAARFAALLITGTILIGACSTAEPTPTPVPSPTPLPTATPSPTPTPLPTPRYTNAPDAALSALIPDTIDGATVDKPPVADYAMTPGDVGGVFGNLGRRFASLVIAYVPPRRLTLLAMRVDGDPVATADLQPYLAAAAEYVGIAGLHPDAWKPAVVGGYTVWTRGSDEATLPGTTLYCWSSGGYVFLLIGTSDSLNQALVSALPGEPAPTPTPAPSSTVAPSSSATETSSSTPTPAGG